ncbi:IPT/TIG domain-containing protein [Mucilaginibacter sp. McL0603]|uniref:IPT/TIG domain-containing protein n=1 Tax=Mucilaginibacter sp. McL0603 TaxID=3415670 RepID=UPI003CEF70BC
MKKHSLCLSIIILLLASIQLQSCKKDKTRDPEIQTTSVTALSPTKVLFKGNIVSTGSFKVLDYGFVYSTTTSGINETVGTKVSLGSNPQVGQYSKEVDGITATNSYQPIIYARAYITNEKGTAFGTLTSVTLPTPTASTVSPQSGRSGDQITINGQFFTAAVTDVRVSFSNIQATVLSVSPTQIVVTVPSGIPAAHDSQVPIQVSVGGQSSTIPYSFTIQANVKDYSPKSGPIGTLITFTGDNLPSYYNSYSDLSLLFGSVSQSISSNYSSSMQATVPSNIATNSFQISVVVSGKTNVLPGTFNVTAPTITSISPTSGLAGSIVTVTGTNFPTYYGTITATLGNETVSASPYSSDQFSFTVPTDLSAGSYTFTLAAGPNSVSASQKFTVTAPTITSFTPSSGAVGGQVTITGSFIAGQYYTVYFGTSSTQVYASSANTLTVNVPYGTSAGAVKISAVINGQTITAPGTFTVATPAITSFSPTSGVAGSVVTITGTGFNSPYGTSVAFGTINASILSVTSTTITVAVPSNTGNGAMKITVNTAGQSVVSTDNFTVTN